MAKNNAKRGRFGRMAGLLIALGLIASCSIIALRYVPKFDVPVAGTKPRLTPTPNKSSVTAFEPRRQIDTSGFTLVVQRIQPWAPTSSLEEIRAAWKNIGYQFSGGIDQIFTQQKTLSLNQQIHLIITKAQLLNYEGEPAKAYQELERAKSLLKGKDEESTRWLYSLLYFQGICALRRGETENCIMCRGESSCVLPISTAAMHTKPEGSTLAIQHFTDYLKQFPQDLEVRWLLNLAHMTLGQYPEQVDPAYRISLDRWLKSEFDIGRFRDIGERAGVNQLNQSGGAIMEDFDNDGLLDLAVTSFDTDQPMTYYRNSGDGTFDDRSESAGVKAQVGGGLYCVQGDYNNDGRMDIFIPRGAWLYHPVRPTLLRNNGDGTFADVTAQANLMAAMNSNSAAWADYDNDGFLDLFVCGERQPSCLYHNKGDGTFEEVSEKAGVKPPGVPFCKAATWLDYDNDRYPDVFLSFQGDYSRLYHNNHDGSFTEVTGDLGINGPKGGFSCWAWDYDNDGWLDIFATCYERTLGDVVKGLIGEPHERSSNRLYRNLKGKGFEDVTKAAGLDMVFATMGSNFADFDNDGFLDMYLATGDPNLATLIPNRMFKNVAGTRFAEISASSGTGHLQKGHAVACGDWDRDGDVDMFVQMGGAINGDKYHNVLFENPGQGNHWLTLKLVGQKSNRAAIGARIKAVTAGKTPQTIHRHITSGSSFGANTLQQTLGLAKADRIATLEIEWPTSGTTQVFHDVAADQTIEITEFAKDYRKLDWKPIVQPKASTAKP